MTKRKSVKRALLSSVMSIILCFTMLLGTTFAWFTDSASTSRNTIQSGNLDMKVSFKPYGAEYTDWVEVTESEEIFGKDALYEPGYTEAVWLKVENEGSLAFRYNMNVDIHKETEGTNKAGEKFKLSDSLTVMYGLSTNDVAAYESFTDSREALLNNFDWKEAKLSQQSVQVAANNVLYSKTDEANKAWSTSYVCVVLHMPETVGNEANHNGDVPKIELGLNAVATQVPHEADSFGNNYDAGAEYPDAPELPDVYEAATSTELTAAIEQAGSGDIVRLTNDVNVQSLSVEKDVTIDLNDKTLSGNNNGWGIISLKNGASMKNGSIKVTTNVAAIRAWKAGTIEDVEINVSPKDTNKVVTGIAVQQSGTVGTIKNVTITGVTQGIEVSYQAHVNRIEGTTVTAVNNGSEEGTALVINGGSVGKAVDCSFSGAMYGVNMHLKGEYDVALVLENCKVATTAEKDGCALYAWDEQGISNNTNCSLTLTYDNETSFEGDIVTEFEEECRDVVKINGATPTI